MNLSSILKMSTVKPPPNVAAHMASNSDLIPKLNEIPITFTHSSSKFPTKANATDAGYDLYSVESGVIAPQTHKKIDVGIKIAIPTNLYGRVAPRSGLAYKHGIDVFAGVIDSGYRGNVGVILYNASREPFKYEVGDRVAQLILEKYEPNTTWKQLSDQEFKDLDILKSTSHSAVNMRGDKGFGSTGQ